jgi:hypothetical protein
VAFCGVRTEIRSGHDCNIAYCREEYKIFVKKYPAFLQLAGEKCIMIIMRVYNGEDRDGF